MHPVAVEIRDALSRGAPEGIEAIWQAYGPRLRRLCRCITGDEQHADALTAEVALAIYDAAVGAAFPADFDAWLFSVAVAAARWAEPRAPTPSQGDESERIDAILATMPIESRLILALHDVLGFDCAQTAGLLGMEEPEVRARACDARLNFLKRWTATGRVREPNR